MTDMRQSKVQVASQSRRRVVLSIFGLQLVTLVLPQLALADAYGDAADTFWLLVGLAAGSSALLASLLMRAAGLGGDPPPPPGFDIEFGEPTILPPSPGFDIEFGEPRIQEPQAPAYDPSGFPTRT